MESPSLKRQLQSFFALFLFTVIANQVLLFGACLQPYCIVAATPHCLIIAIALTVSLRRKDWWHELLDGIFGPELKKGAGQALPPRTIAHTGEQMRREREAANRAVRELLNGTTPAQDDLRREVGAVEILPEYKLVLDRMTNGEAFTFVTGKAGTGKSTLVRWLVTQLENVAVLAPTGIAALNIGGSTIHSFFRFDPGLMEPNQDDTPLRTQTALKTLKYLVLDEVSMLTPNLIDAMDQRLRSVRENQRPFGGVPVLLVGDLLQLPPVITDHAEVEYFSHRYWCEYFFAADVYKQHSITAVELRKIRRQSDPEFVEALNAIRTANDYRSALAFFNNRCLVDPNDSNDPGIILVPSNQAARRINDKCLNELAGRPHTFEAEITGKVKANQWSLPVPHKLVLKVGAKVLFAKNNRPLWINGSLGTIVSISSDDIQVKLKSSAATVRVTKEKWEKYQYRYNSQTKKLERESIGSFTQFPLTLGWSITIHKSQGMSLEQMTLDLTDRAFAKGQTYVGLSRATSLAGLRLKHGIRMSDVKPNPLVVGFYRDLGLIT